MKLLFASDIHGSAPAMQMLLERLSIEKPDHFFLLGDLLYHGPRNELPRGYDTFAVTRMLNECPLVPNCVRGNCDAEVDQMVLHFPIMADYCLFPLENGKTAFLTHGHLFNEETPPPHKPGDVLIHGHTHVHGFFPQADYLSVNPGSAALPKEGQPPTYMIYEAGTFTIRELFSGADLLLYSL